MFGMGLGEIILIAIVAVLFLGPEKLPKAMVDVAKFFKTIKKTLMDAKEAIDKETHISEIKEQTLEYKKNLEKSTNDFSKDFSLDSLDEEKKGGEEKKEEPTTTSKTPPLSPNSAEISKDKESKDV